jgi:hypothetical protein
MLSSSSENKQTSITGICDLTSAIDAISLAMFEHLAKQKLLAAQLSFQS